MPASPLKALDRNPRRDSTWSSMLRGRSVAGVMVDLPSIDVNQFAGVHHGTTESAQAILLDERLGGCVLLGDWHSPERQLKGAINLSGNVVSTSILRQPLGE